VPDFAADVAERVRCATLLAEWDAQLAAGHLTEGGLWEIRARLRSAEFDPVPGQAYRLLLAVVRALMVARCLTTWPIADEFPVAPDDVSGLVASDGPDVSP